MKVNLSGHPLAQNNYFYLDGKLYKVLQVNRASDFLSAWCYDDQGVQEFFLPHIRKKAEPAFGIRAVSEILGRTVQTIYNNYINDDVIIRPTKTYPLDGTMRSRRASPRYWSKQDIYDMYDVFASRHTVVKKDGTVSINNRQLQSKAELRAKLENQMVYFVQGKDGKMIRAFSAGDL